LKSVDLTAIAWENAAAIKEKKKQELEKQARTIGQ
jgi:hypothetical protein